MYEFKLNVEKRMEISNFCLHKLFQNCPGMYAKPFVTYFNLYSLTSILVRFCTEKKLTVAFITDLLQNPDKILHCLDRNRQF